MFCFPHGMRLIRADKFSQPSPSAFSFVFTESTGRHVHVACLVLYEPADEEALRALEQQYVAMCPLIIRHKNPIQTLLLLLNAWLTNDWLKTSITLLLRYAMVQAPWDFNADDRASTGTAGCK